ncbi:p-loop containing nucleoside triphosphate hydrolase [Gigaspora margarita]|uniref:p-loop containing nucleoside triphosphate hydrolase n=1 Tax=Gigaspora margarita TaxID=4874 RepID=A0A8H4EL77_GIGMA|nr:p-loop containing nucleoside triphosphate hydrolase [Gigaspora margarita]
MITVIGDEDEFDIVDTVGESSTQVYELLSHLHKSAKDNIVFCFTNTRGTFFCTGDTFPILQRQLQELKENFEIEIKIGRNIIYCFDNESFRFLAAKKEGMMFTDDEKRNFASNTFSLINARQIVLLLRELLAEIDRNIQVNIVEAEKLKKEIQKADLSSEELIKNLYVPHIEIKIIPLD